MNLTTNIFSVNEVEKLLDKNIEFIKSSKKKAYANVPCVIDIESSSFYENGEKRATMYAFVIGINGKCIIGRTYDELIMILNKVSEFYSLDTDKRMIFYVHNLAYEFQFFRRWFNWTQVFGIDTRKVAYAVTDIGIELRCSYILSGYSLHGVGNILTKYKVEKKIGDLDYSLIRHTKTPLTNKELGYILYDGLVVMAYIQEEIERCHNNITLIPLTKTGKVREYCRKSCLNNKKNKSKFFKYRRMMNGIRILSIKEYEQLKRAFAGGFTHANSLYVGKEVEDVTSYDFTSSYPYVLISEQFPMKNGELISIKSIEEFRRNLQLYCCLFDITFTNLESTQSIDHPISEYKAYKIAGAKIDNGHVVSAETISITITEQDFFVIEQFYKWEHMKIKNFRRYKRGYLPTDFVKCILKLYADKTTLKGVAGREVDYLVSKENVNSVYGMCSTDICRNELNYKDNIENIDTGGWESSPCDYEKTLEKYNNSKKRFIAYQWGVWCTAYARRNLLIGNGKNTYCIRTCGHNYVYADTDSIKSRKIDAYKDKIENYNKIVIEKLKRACTFHNIDFSLVSPKTIKGEEKTLGLWDYDGTYPKFKTLGKKRYMVKATHMYEYENKTFTCPYSFTISGLSKETGIPYLYKKHGEDIMSAFADGMYIPPQFTGKNTHTYLDFEQRGMVKDYRGDWGEYHELSSIHMENADYELSLSREFIDFLMDIQQFDE